MKGELVFRKMTNLEDSFIEEADFGLDDGLMAPTFPQKLGKFFTSGLGVAVICGVLGLGIFGAILWSGQHDPFVPPISTVESEAETEAEATEAETETMAETESEIETETETVTEPETETETEPETEFELVTDENGAAVFAPVGNVKLTVNSNLSRTVTLDGDFTDWEGFVYRKLIVSPNNTVSHEGEGIESVMPMDFKMTTYVAIDRNRLYFGFDVTDENFVYASSDTSFDGDSITVAVDFGNLFKRQVQINPDFNDLMLLSYTFSCAEDGKQLTFLRNANTPNDNLISYASGGTINGVAQKTDTGWAAEFFVQWDQLYEDFTYQMYIDDDRVNVADDTPFLFSWMITYTKRDESNTNILWKATTAKGPITNSYEDCGIQCWVPISISHNDIRINCEGIRYWYTEYLPSDQPHDPNDFEPVFE